MRAWLCRAPGITTGCRQQPEEGHFCFPCFLGNCAVGDMEWEWERRTLVSPTVHPVLYWPARLHIPVILQVLSLCYLKAHVIPHTVDWKVYDSGLIFFNKSGNINILVTLAVTVCINLKDEPTTCCVFTSVETQLIRTLKSET